MYAKGDMQTSVEVCKTVVGALAAETGNFEHAIILFEKAIQIDETQSELHDMLAQCALEKGDDVRALKAAKRAVELNSQSFDAQCTLARCLYNSKQLEESIDTFKAALRLDQHNKEILQELAEAEDILRQHQNSDSREVVLRGGRARVLLEQQAGEQAGPATVIWECAAVLATFLAHEGNDQGGLITHKTVIELGTGTGAVGLTAAALGGRVLLTDREPASVALASRNLARNLEVIEAAGGEARVDTLEWSRPEDLSRLMQDSGPWEVILGADLVYNVDMIVPVCTVLRGLFPPQPVLSPDTAPPLPTTQPSHAIPSPSTRQPSHKEAQHPEHVPHSELSSLDSVQSPPRGSSQHTHLQLNCNETCSQNHQDGHRDHHHRYGALDRDNDTLGITNSFASSIPEANSNSQVNDCESLHNPVFLLAHKHRHADVDALLLQMLDAEDFRVQVIPRGLHHPDFSSPSISIYKIFK